MIQFVPCCGGTAFLDVNLPGDFEVDLSGTVAPNGRVDGFLTAGDCTRLFDGSYDGVAANPRCTIYIGPVGPGTVSPRKKVTRGKYRIFAQAFTSNGEPAPFILDMAIWNNACRWNPIAP